MASHATGDGGIPPRDAAERGLKRVMSLGGAYGTRNHTVKNLRDHKGKRVLVETLPFSPEEAAAAVAELSALVDSDDFAAVSAAVDKYSGHANPDVRDACSATEDRRETMIAGARASLHKACAKLGHVHREVSKATDAAAGGTRGGRWTGGLPVALVRRRRRAPGGPLAARRIKVRAPSNWPWALVSGRT